MAIYHCSIKIITRGKGKTAVSAAGFVLAEDWRKAWAAYCNAALRIHGHGAVIDHRIYPRQGIEQIPTVHMGAAASQMERKGIATERGNVNREIAVTNSQIRQLRARINRVKDWLKTEAANTAPPTLTDVISEILNHREGASQYAKIAGLKSAAKVFNFLKENDVSDMAGLAGKVSKMYDRLHDADEPQREPQQRKRSYDIGR
jgi:hypothetical protein